MVDLKTAIDEINTGKLYFEQKDENTSTMTTEGEVVIYLEMLENLFKVKDKLEDKNVIIKDLDEKNRKIIIDILCNGTYSQIFD